MPKKPKSKWFKKDEKLAIKEKPFSTRPVISNIVASGRLPKEIDIEKIYKTIKFEQSEYNPETYPALLVKVLVNGVRRHVTLYRNGKYILTGAKSEEELNQVYDEIVSILKKHNFL